MSPKEEMKQLGKPIYYNGILIGYDREGDPEDSCKEANNINKKLRTQAEEESSAGEELQPKQKNMDGQPKPLNKRDIQRKCRRSARLSKIKGKENYTTSSSDGEEQMEVESGAGPEGNDKKQVHPTNPEGNESNKNKLNGMEVGDLVMYSSDDGDGDGGEDEGETDDSSPKKSQSKEDPVKTIDDNDRLPSDRDRDQEPENKKTGESEGNGERLAVEVNDGGAAEQEVSSLKIQNTVTVIKAYDFCNVCGLKNVYDTMMVTYIQLNEHEMNRFVCQTCFKRFSLIDMDRHNAECFLTYDEVYFKGGEDNEPKLENGNTKFRMMICKNCSDAGKKIKV